MPETFVDRTTVLPEAMSLKVCRIDGGWVIHVQDCLPLACQTAQQVLDAVRLFLKDASKLPNWSIAPEGSGPVTQIGGLCAISKIDHGYLVVAVYGQNENLQFLRFTAREVSLTVAQWLGLRETLVSFSEQPTHFEDPNYR